MASGKVRYSLGTIVAEQLVCSGSRERSSAVGGAADAVSRIARSTHHEKSGAGPDGKRDTIQDMEHDSQTPTSCDRSSSCYDIIMTCRRRMWNLTPTSFLLLWGGCSLAMPSLLPLEPPLECFRAPYSPQ